MKDAERDEQKVLRLLVWTTTLVLIVALVWASVFDLDEITRGQGRVIPASREQVVQSLEAGILSELIVREGDLVEKDQILLRVDDIRSGSLYRESREKMLALLAQATRLRAEAYGTSLVFPMELDSMPSLAERERQAYAARRQALEQQVSALRRSLVAVTREVTLTAPMVKRGVVSEVELLRLQRQQADLDGQIAERTNRYLTDANNELGRVESDLAQTREMMLAREDAFKRAVMRSPMKGIVKNIQITTVGAVIQAGQNILEIIPTQDEMLVEAYVKPAEIAFLVVGQPVVIKLTAYDFNKYGGLKGELVHFSPDTLRDEARNRKSGIHPVELDEGYYRLLVRFLDPDEKRHGVVLHPSPGMTATVEILTGKKTVIEYLFRPLQSVTQALRER
jgi:membrane fusion protein, adhesin transport system